MRATKMLAQLLHDPLASYPIGTRVKITNKQTDYITGYLTSTDDFYNTESENSLRCRYSYSKSPKYDQKITKMLFKDGIQRLSNIFLVRNIQTGNLMLIDSRDIVAQDTFYDPEDAPVNNRYNDLKPHQRTTQPQ